MPSVIVFDYTVWESFVSIEHEGGWGKGQAAFVHYMLNLESDVDEDEGIAAGFEIGGGSPGDLSAFLAAYDFEADAFFSPVAQDDTPIAGTGIGRGMDGFLGGVRYVVSDRFAVRLWGLTSDASAADDSWRVRLDLDFQVK
jgi:hypothetical protein